jgi:hypothetical protein
MKSTKLLLGIMVFSTLFLFAFTKVDQSITPAQVNEMTSTTQQNSQVMEKPDDNIDKIEESNDALANNYVEIDTEKSTFEFEGYGVGKSHPGKFNVYLSETYPLT